MRWIRLIPYVLALLCALPSLGAENRTAPAYVVDPIPTQVDCTATISGGRLAVPCVMVGSEVYRAEMAMSGSAFTLASTTAGVYGYAPACLGYFLASSGRLYLPCVSYGGSQYRAYLEMGAYPNFQLSAAWLADRGSADQQNLHDYNALVSAIVQANRDFAQATSQLESSALLDLTPTQARAQLHDYINAGEVLEGLLTKLGEIETTFSARAHARPAATTRGSFDWLLGFLPDTSGVSADLAKKVGDNIAAASVTRSNLDYRLATGQIDDYEYKQGIQQGLLSGFGSAIRFGALAILGTGAGLIVGGAVAAAGGTAGIVLGAGVLASAATGATLDWFTGGCSGNQCTISTGSSQPGSTVQMLPVTNGTLVVASDGNIPVTMAVSTTANQQASIDFAPTKIENYVAGGRQTVVVSDTPADDGGTSTSLDLSGTWSGTSSITIGYSTSYSGQTVSSDSSTMQQAVTLNIAQNGDVVTLSVPGQGQLGVDNREIVATLGGSGFSYSSDELFSAYTRPQGVSEEYYNVSGSYANGTLTLTTTVGYTQSYQGVVNTVTSRDVATLTRTQ
jgi:hypothetical protein